MVARHGELHAVVDLDDMTVVRVEDLGVVPLPPGTGDYTTGASIPRAGLKPIELRQPAGVSFQVDGWEVRWQNWRFRLGFNAREGLVLHTVGCADRGRLRPVIRRPVSPSGRSVSSMPTLRWMWHRPAARKPAAPDGPHGRRLRSRGRPATGLRYAKTAISCRRRIGPEMLTATLVEPRPGGQGRTGMTAGTFGLLRGQGGIEPDEPCRVGLVEFGDGFA
jgi:Copper amine oxidase, enzyme domain